MIAKHIFAFISLSLLALSCSKPEESTGSVEVTVKDGTLWSAADPEGKPADLAEVTLYRQPADYRNNNAAYSAQSDASGKVVFNGLAPGTYYFVVKKLDKLNYFEPWEIAGLPIGYRATGIFQSQAQINTAPHLTGAQPGDFQFADLNGDGKLDDRDKENVPFELTVTAGQTTRVTSLIGYLFNHNAALFTSKEQVQLLLDNLYAQTGDWHKMQLVLDGVLSDDAGCTWLADWCPLDNFTFTSSNAIIGGFWQTAYSLISQLNRVIVNVPRLNLPPTDADGLTAQARGMRGFIYGQLASYFGGLPLQDQITAPGDIMRAPISDTYQFIKSDLTAAQAVLPPYWTGADRRRMGANACKLLLARLALFQDDPVRAAQYTDELIQSGTYQLVGAAQIFVSDDNAEVVWNMAPGIPAQYETFFADTVTRTFCPALRYSEVLLINSEAKVLLGNLDAAGQNLNRLRARRNLSPLTLANSTEATAAVRSAWQSEQYREGQRFVKLVKWGAALSTLGGKGFHYNNSLLPIPMAIQTEYRNIMQNPGY